MGFGEEGGNGRRIRRTRRTRARRERFGDISGTGLGLGEGREEASGSSSHGWEERGSQGRGVSFLSVKP